jgi:peptidoglycan/LPS O-acetylase OafA/YrhL
MSAPAARIIPAWTQWLRSRSLAEAFESGADNFLLLRFLAASMVIYGHSYPLSGMHKTDIFARVDFGADAGNTAVRLFFCISGFLVTGSLVRWPNMFAFVKARALRLFPAYAACLILCAMVLGSLLTSLPIGEYLHQPDVVRYVSGNLSLCEVRFVLPGVVFSNTEAGTVVNGSIWTLPGEATMYLWLAALGLLRIFHRPWLATAAVLFVVALAANYWLSLPALVTDERYVPFAAMFAIGAIAYLQRRHVPLSHGGMLCLAVLAWASHGTVIYPWMIASAEAYFCFWFAYCIPWHGFNRFGDYSYGIYLWGYPCEQLMVRWLGHPRPLEIVLLAFPLALILAVASWHCIEQPALRLKKVPITTRLIASILRQFGRFPSKNSNPAG